MENTIGTNKLAPVRWARSMGKCTVCSSRIWRMVCAVMVGVAGSRRLGGSGTTESRLSSAEDFGDAGGGVTAEARWSRLPTSVAGWMMVEGARSRLPKVGGWIPELSDDAASRPCEPRSS